jgi:endoglucanase
MRIIILFSALLFATFISAQPIIYNDTQTLITGTWNNAGTGGSSTLTEVTGETPHEGTKHYKFIYSFTNWWAGVGLNMDNWGNSGARNLSGYTHLRIAYRGLSSGQILTIQLRNGANFGNQVDIGGTSGTYTVVDIAMSALTANGNVNANAIREIDLAVSSATQSGSGTVYFDAIELVNSGGGGNNGLPASPETMARASSLSLGVNTSNWLEAWWLIQFGAYPEVNKYNRAKVSALRNAGFTTFRLPVIFERLGSTSAPYLLDFNHTAFRLVDSMILWANEYDFKLIIDNHHGYDLTDANYTTQIPRLVAVWEQLTDRYDYLDPNRFFFEVYNEPHAISNANWRVVATNIIQAIRNVESQTHSILVGGNGYNSGNGLMTMTPLADANIIYSFHNYDPYYFTHQGMSWTSPSYFPPLTFPQSGEVAAINSLFASLKNWGETNGVPVNLGEFGVSTSADATSRCNWVNTLANAYSTNGFSAFYWDAISPSDAFGFFTGGVISSGACIPCFKTALGLYVTVPVSLLSFTAHCTDNTVALNWRAFSNDNNAFFEVERSTDNQNWEPMEQLAVNKGTFDYTFREPVPPTGKTYYRLKTTDDNGQISYSPSQIIHCSRTGVIVVYPNPAQQSTTISTNGTDSYLLRVAMYDVTGRTVQEKTFGKDEQNTTFAIETRGFPAGVYLLHITGNRTSEVVELIVEE